MSNSVIANSCWGRTKNVRYNRYIVIIVTSIVITVKREGLCNIKANWDQNNPFILFVNYINLRYNRNYYKRVRLLFQKASPFFNLN